MLSEKHTHLLQHASQVSSLLPQIGQTEGDLSEGVSHLYGLQPGLLARAHHSLCRLLLLLVICLHAPAAPKVLLLLRPSVMRSPWWCWC